jgi:UDP-N-acetylmuramyl pentapeptide phosphotransferase/UDP-N-acetylglucosamine-1-phosphate transferase
MNAIDILHIASELALLFAAAASITAGLLALLHPLLVRCALARPNARSSHDKPTPQGGGIAVIAATISVLAGIALLAHSPFTDPLRLTIVFAGVIGLAVVGITDDIRPLGALPRLLMQAVAVLVVLVTLPPGLLIFSTLPWWIERALTLVVVLWFVNLVNFMDGIDWMTVTEVVPVTAALALFGFMDALPRDATLVSLILCGAMIGFAPFNKPVARLFLGDVGSLPIGLLLGWLLVLLAGSGHLAAAILLPLYYLADATITLLRRLAKGEPIWQAHRSHFYQRATDNGFSVTQIVGRVFLLNIALIALATVTLLTASLTIHIAVLIAGGVLVGLLLYRFASARA